MQIICEMPGCAERLIGKLPICAKCKKRIPEGITQRLGSLASAGKFGAEYRDLMKAARDSILRAQQVIQQSITEAEQELEKKLDELYPPMIVDMKGEIPKVSFPEIEMPFLTDPPIHISVGTMLEFDKFTGKVKAINKEEKPMDAEAAVQAYNWLAVYATAVTLILGAVLILVFAGRQ